ncbi:RFC2 [Symbiodinium sp. CCMP2592]|nr:RFC2 [Symbiodinium sp. CCMP2592]
MPDIWLEKYRPIKFEDVVGNSAAVTILRSHATAGTFPHLLLTGPPGCGKTTVVHCLAREHLKEHYEQGCIELNASDDRGIDVVREKIKGFAQQKVSLPEGKLKVIILDEADSMTQAAQQAMRRTMEIFSETTRFALACNISSKIIEPIQSRCAILRFSRISDEEMLQRLKFVLEKEGAPYDQSGLEALAFSAEGDMRNALNGAQSTFNAFGEINKATVFRMNDQPQPEKVKSCLEASLKKDAKGTFGPMHEIWNQGYSTTDIISTFSRVAKQMEAPEHIKLEWLKEIGLAHARVTGGAANLLQLDAMVSKIILASERGTELGFRAPPPCQVAEGLEDDNDMSLLTFRSFLGPWDRAGPRASVLLPGPQLLTSRAPLPASAIDAIAEARLRAVMLGRITPSSLLQSSSRIFFLRRQLSQQCLAPGHWTYECKNGSTYQVRASASRQLKQKRFKQAFLEEEAPEVPYNAFLGDDRARFGTRKDTAPGPPEKKPKTEKDAKEKNEKKSKKKKESSSSSSSDSDSSSSSSS